MRAEEANQLAVSSADKCLDEVKAVVMLEIRQAAKRSRFGTTVEVEDRYRNSIAEYLKELGYDAAYVGEGPNFTQRLQIRWGKADQGAG